MKTNTKIPQKKFHMFLAAKLRYPIPNPFPKFLFSTSLMSQYNSNNNAVHVSQETQTQQTASLDDFFKINLIIGQIKHVESVKKSTKLLMLRVDMGKYGTDRIILSGIAPYYPIKFNEKQEIEHELLNKKCIFVENLEKKKMFGLESHGMLLVAYDDNLNRMNAIIADQQIPNGTKVS